MPEGTSKDATDDARRFDLALFIVHPSLDPTEISAALGLKAQFVHRVGDPRTTPKGTALPGTYADTRWRYVIRHEVTDQWFAHELEQFVTQISSRKAYLDELRARGGQVCVLIQFLGDGYLGDQIPTNTLSRLADLGVDLGIECFVVPQS